MRNKLAVAGLIVVLIATMALATGCRRVPLEDVEGNIGLATETKSVALDGAEKIDARIRMAAGELSLEGGSQGALDATFESSPRSWLPDVEYSVEGTAGVLRVSQPDMDDLDFFGSKRNDWNLKLASGVPIDLEIEMGAGESDLDLVDVDVRDLRVLTGAGESTIDLSGTRDHDVRADIQAGVGEVNVLVPEDVGVRITGSQEGIGDYTLDDFDQDGSGYVNDAWDSSEVRIEIRLQRGVGSVNVEQVP